MIKYFFSVNTFVLILVNIFGYLGLVYPLGFIANAFFIISIILQCILFFFTDKFTRLKSASSMKKINKNRIEFVISYLLILFYGSKIFFAGILSKELAYIFIEDSGKAISSGLIDFFLIYWTVYFSGKYLRSNIMISLILMILLAFFGVKGVVLIAIVGAISLNYVLHGVLEKKYMLIFIALGVSMFILQYLTNISISQKFIGYFSAGLVGFQEGLSSYRVLDPLPLISPLNNILYPESKVFPNTFMVNISAFYDSTSNVRTSYGTVFLSGKTFGFGTLCLAIFLIINAIVYGIARFALNYRFYFLAAGLFILLSTVFFAWFEFYLWHSFIWYCFLFGTGLQALSSFYEYFRRCKL